MMRFLFATLLQLLSGEPNENFTPEDTTEPCALPDINMPDSSTPETLTPIPIFCCKKGPDPLHPKCICWSSWGSCAHCQITAPTPPSTP